MKRQLLAAIGLLFLGCLEAFHVFGFNSGWPGLVLFLVATLLFLVPVADIGIFIESLEFGKTKILFRQTKALQEQVDEVLIGAGEKIGTNLATAEDSSECKLPEENASVPLQKTSSLQFDAHAHVLDPPNTSFTSDMPLIQLSLEIERVLAELCRHSAIPVPASGLIWGQAVAQLRASGVLDAKVATALLAFRELRNRIVHASDVSRSDSDRLSGSTIESGAKLLAILRAKLTGSGKP